MRTRGGSDDNNKRSGGRGPETPLWLHEVVFVGVEGDWSTVVLGCTLVEGVMVVLWLYCCLTS